MKYKIGEFYRTHNKGNQVWPDNVYLVVDGRHPLNLKFYGRFKRGVYEPEKGQRFVYGQEDSACLISCTPEDVQAIMLAEL